MQRRWLVTLQDLPSTGRQWDTDVPMAVLADAEIGEVDPLRDLCSDIHWQLSIEPRSGLCRMTGKWQGRMRRSCSRCPADFDWSVSGETERLYQLGGSHLDVSDDDACEQLPPPGEINLVDILREDVWLTWKSDVICSDSCKGLCQGCGINLNCEPCRCKQDDSDHPFAALRSLKLDGE